MSQMSFLNLLNSLEKVKNPLTAKTPIDNKKSRVYVVPTNGIIEPKDKLLSVKELAYQIGFHQMTIYDWIERKGLPVRRSSGKGRFTIVWSEFQKWWSDNGKI